MKIAFLFPGQGSQSVGMGADLYAKYPAAAKVFDEIDEQLGYKLSSLCFYGPDESLRATNVAQPALFAVSIVALEVLTAGGIVPQAVAGHSVGEYSALVASGAVSRYAALTLVGQRGDAMRKASESAPGAMAAVIGMDAHEVAGLCVEIESSGLGIVEAANINGAGQVVVSGEPAAVQALSDRAAQRGAKRVIMLPVSGGFHSRLMAPAAASMRPFLDDAAIADAKIPIVANATAEYEQAASEIRRNLTAQIDHAVLWEQSMQRMLDEGFDTFVEVGAGTVLSGLMKRIAKEAAVYSTNDASALELALGALSGAAYRS